MHRPKLYFKTTRILFEAFRNETLFHTNWGSCAVGNLIAANMGCTVETCSVNWSIWPIGYWYTKDGHLHISTLWYGKLIEARTFIDRYLVRLEYGKEKYDLQKKLLQATGYSIKELRKIIAAFDSCDYGVPCKGNVLAGLEEVLIVLKQLHKVRTIDLKSRYYLEFVNENNRLKSLVDGKLLTDIQLKSPLIRAYLKAKNITTGDHSTLMKKKQIPHSLTKELMPSEAISI